MSKKYCVIVNVSIYGQFGAIQILDALSKKIMFLFIVTFYLKKIENRTKISLTHHSHYCFN